MGSEDPIQKRTRVRALLQFLILHPRSSRERIAAALCPEHDQAAAMNNLRVTLNHLMRLMEPDREPDEPSYSLRSKGNEIHLYTGDALRIDFRDFESDLDAAADHDRAGNPGASLDHLERALARYRGDFLADAENRDWGEVDRTRLRSRFLRAALRAASLRLSRGDFDRALTHIGRAIEVGDLHEPAYHLHGLTCIRAGDVSGARLALQSGLRKLEREGIRPSDDLRRLARRVGVRSA